MSGYVIANIDVKNPEAYKEYVGKVVPTVQNTTRPKLKSVILSSKL